MGFRSLAIEQRSSEVWKLLGAVKNDFARFADVLEKTQQRLRQATESIDTAFVPAHAPFSAGWARWRPPMPRLFRPGKRIPRLPDAAEEAQ